VRNLSTSVESCGTYGLYMVTMNLAVCCGMKSGFADVIGGDYAECAFHGARASSSARYVHSCWSEHKSVSHADARVPPVSQ
jgi:hypothetical protein